MQCLAKIGLICVSKSIVAAARFDVAVCSSSALAGGRPSPGVCGGSEKTQLDIHHASGNSKISLSQHDFISTPTAARRTKALFGRNDRRDSRAGKEPLSGHATIGRKSEAT